MEERKTIFDILSQIMITFGITILVLNILCIGFGDSAREFSTIFSLGGQGISVNTSLQFLGVAILIAMIRNLFFTDVLIKRMPVWLRTVCMLVAVVILVAGCIIVFDWFPVTMWQPWVMFFLCFIFSFMCSLFVIHLKERLENRQLEEALHRLKEKEDNK